MKPANILTAFVAILTFTLTFGTFNCLAQTTVNSGFVYGTWTLAGSPYNVQGSIQIPNDSTLTIQSGVTVKFWGTYRIEVQGRLLAVGNSIDSINFIPADTINGWRGIRFSSTPSTNDTSKLYFCKLGYAKATGSSPYDDGGALYIDNTSKVIISNCLISNCFAAHAGAGVYCSNGNPVIANSLLDRNEAVAGGAGIYATGSNAIITNNTISNNLADSYGCGISTHGNTVITGNRIFNNQTNNGSGAGIECTGDAVISNNTIYNNVVFGGYGGGISYTSGSPLISGNEIYSNTSVYGGGIACHDNLVTSSVINNRIHDNTSVGGGGIGCINSHGATHIESNTISNNIATVSSGLIAGAGIGCYNSSPEITNNTITNNTVSGPRGGGGIYCGTSSPLVTNNVICNNSAEKGGGLYCDGNSDPSFLNCILYGNTATDTGAEVYLLDEPSDPDFNYCDLQGGFQSINYNANFYSGQFLNIIIANPLFVSPSGGSGTGFDGLNADWSVQSNSPCIDAGDPNGIYTASDKAGQPRVAVCRIDMGAYERQNGGPLDATILQTQQVLCHGEATAAVMVTATGGASVYSYHWTGGQTTTTVSNLAAGIYDITVTETNSGCQVIKTITINQPVDALAISPTTTNPVCTSNNGSVDVAPNGGTAPYTYLWSTISNNTDSSLTALTGGSYSVTVTDNNGCSVSASYTLTTQFPSLSLSPATTDPICANNAGSVSITSAGGAVPYSYLWSTATNNTGTSISALPGGTYSVTATDNNGCTIAGSYTLTTQFPSLSLSPITTDPVCANNAGSVSVTSAGGSTPYSYLWSTAHNNTGTSINALPGGTYSVTVTDNNGCTVSDSYTLTTQFPSLSLSPTTTNPVCTNNAGSVSVTSAGGSNPYSYLWSTATNNTGTSISALPGGTYSVTVTDNNGCTVAGSYTLTTQFTSLSLSPTSTDPTCTNNAGNISVTVGGGSTPYSYLWSTATNNTGTSISALPGGNYSVTATDNNGCTVSGSYTLTTQFPSLSLSPTTTDPICTNNAGNVSVTVGGGSTPYSYLWSTVTNNTGTSITALPGGTYSVTVTDNNGCTITDSYTLTTQFSTLTLNKSFTNASCLNNDGDASVTPGGGLTPYSFLWSNASTNQSLSGLGRGTFSVIVTDANGCTVSDSVIITNSVAPGVIPICMVTVDSASTKNVVVWEKPTDAPIDSFKIYREIASNYVLVGSIAYDALSEFTDNTNGINPNITSYKYKLSVLDSCGNESILSDVHQTVHVQLSPAIPQGVNLNWNDYLGFSFSQYRILRDDLGTGNWQIIDSVSFGITSYTSTDVLPNALYIVEAQKPGSCVSTRQLGNTRNSSMSNRASQATAVNELSSLAAVSVYPNPTNGKFIIDFGDSGANANRNCMVEIENIIGEKVYSLQLKMNDRNEVNISGMPPGIYLVKVIADGQSVIRKIIKQ